MPDNEFDSLIRNKFDNAEIQPPAFIWGKIEEELHPVKKRNFPILWMAAASVVVVLSATLMFQKTEKIKLQATTQTAFIVPELKTIEKQAAEKQDDLPSIIAPIGAKVITKTVVETTIEDNFKNNQLALQPIQETERLPIKQQEVKPLDILPITENTQENPIVIAQVDPRQNEYQYAINETEELSSNKGIRNVGDLVNYVVDKVDKRDKKLLRFNTDDDDNSSLIGINIGFLKFNKKNK